MDLRVEHPEEVGEIFMRGCHWHGVSLSGFPGLATFRNLPLILQRLHGMHEPHQFLELARAGAVQPIAISVRMIRQFAIVCALGCPSPRYNSNLRVFSPTVPVSVLTF